MGLLNKIQELGEKAVENEINRIQTRQTIKNEKKQAKKEAKAKEKYMRDSQKVLEKAIKSKEYFRLLDNYSLPANKRGKFNNVLKYNVSLEINKGIQVNEIENKVFMVAEELLNNKEFMTKLVSSDDTDTLLALGMMSNGLDKMF